MRKYDLRGMFKRYEQTYDLSDLCSDKMFNDDGTLKNQIYIGYDEDGGDPYYLEITEKFVDDGGMEQLHSLYSYGKTLDDAEKTLEWKYDNFLKRHLMKPDTQGVIPNLEYLSVSLDTEMLYCEELQQEIEDHLYEKYRKPDNIYSAEDNTLWILGEIEECFQILGVDDYLDYPDNDTKKEFIQNEFCDEEFVRELNFESSVVLFKRGIGIYQMKLRTHKPSLFIHSRHLNQHTLPKIAEAVPISKAEVIHKWKWEQEYLDYGNMKHLSEDDMLKALSFLEEVENEHATLT